MTVKWETVKAGDTLWDVHSEREGNTTLRRMGSWAVEIVSIDHERGSAVVRWNSNEPKQWDRKLIERLRRSPYKSRPQKDRFKPE